MGNDGKTRRRNTTFTFRSLPEMVRAFQRFGIGLREHVSDVSYSWRDETDLDYRERRILQKCGEKVKCNVYQRFKFRWNAQFEIAEYFEFPQGFHYELWHHWIEITTYDLLPSEHKAYMQRIYEALKKEGFEVRHDCDTVIVNNNCV